jgi:hypothetical protein
VTLGATLDVSRETFLRKGRVGIRNYAILQNDPMDQKISQQNQ